MEELETTSLLDTAESAATLPRIENHSESAEVAPVANAPELAPSSLDAGQAEGDTDAAPIQALSDEEMVQAIAALVYASPEPLSEKRLAALLGEAQPARIATALNALKQRLSESRLPLELIALAGGWQILTAPRMAETVQRLFKARKAERVSPAALETLSVIAYRQPVTKAEIEAIRGVQAGPILRTLIDRGLVRVTGRADVPGHPLQYGTTRAFLDRFGLAGLEDLPRDSELAKG